MHTSPAFALACFDVSGSISYADAGYSALLGREQDEIVGHSPFEFILADDFEDNRKRLPAMIETGEPCIFRKHYVQPDGTIVPTQVHAFVLRDATGAAAGICAALCRQDREDSEEAARRFRRGLSIERMLEIEAALRSRSEVAELPVGELRALITAALDEVYRD